VFGFTLPAGLNIYVLVSSVFRIGQQTLIYKLDPSLSPGSGARTVASRDVQAPAKPSGKKGAEEGGRGSASINGNRNGSARPAAAAASTGPAPAPARIANRPANKKKKRR
jgi:membrane protein insertase Oxa1/YidC/SpoIIIJ